MLLLRMVRRVCAAARAAALVVWDIAGEAWADPGFQLFAVTAACVSLLLVLASW